MFIVLLFDVSSCEMLRSKKSSFFYLLMVNGFCHIDNRSLMSYSLSQTPPDSKSGNCFFQPPEVFECGRGLDIGPSVAPKKGGFNKERW